jgi:hypothetical protein
MSWLGFLFLLLNLSFAQTPQKTIPMPSPTPPPSPVEVIDQINKYSPEELSKLTFLELYILKNAILANKGYKFADDREALRHYFGDSCLLRDQMLGKDGCKINRQGIQCAACPKFNLSIYKYPEVTNNDHFIQTPKMEISFAKIRQAGLLKLKKISNPSALDREFEQQLAAFGEYSSNYQLGTYEIVVVFGREFATSLFVEQPPNGPDVFEDYTGSILRDLKGDLSLLSLIERFKQGDYDFDKAELLGLYLGNLDFLRKVIYSLSGKEFPEPLRSELSALGVTAKPMTLGNLSPSAQKALNHLEEAMKTLVSGEMSDLPSSFRESNLEIDDTGLGFSYSNGM